MDPQPRDGSVMIACPDARPPAYQAVIGLLPGRLLDRFVTSSYFNPDMHLLPGWRGTWPLNGTRSGRRCSSEETIPRFPPSRVVPCRSSTSCFESSRGWLAGFSQSSSSACSQRHVPPGSISGCPELWLAVALPRYWSSATSARSGRLPLCRRLGIPTVLSMVHGDVREEIEMLDQEAKRLPGVFPDLPGRRVARPQGARLATPAAVARHRTCGSDPCAFGSHRQPTYTATGYRQRGSGSFPMRRTVNGFVRPRRNSTAPTCTFLFAGGITQRKGIKYLLEAWERVRRPWLEASVARCVAREARPPLQFA